MSRRITPSFAVSVLALVVALGGTSYAAYQLPRNSVDTPQIKKHAVTKSKISREAKVALKGQTGPAGAAGPAGPSFSDTVYFGNLGATGCTAKTVSMPVTVTTSSRILSIGQGAYERGMTNLNSGRMEVGLRQGGVLVAGTRFAIGTNTAAGNQRVPIVVSGVLATAADMTVPYVAAPGNYLLELTLQASDGTCSGTPSWWSTSLTYMLTGTAP